MLIQMIIIVVVVIIVIVVVIIIVIVIVVVVVVVVLLIILALHDVAGSELREALHGVGDAQRHVPVLLEREIER